MIYFIQTGEDGPIKVGQAVDPIRRLSGLQTGNPQPLSLRAIIDEKDMGEGEWHRLLNNSRVRGEWFDAGDALALLDELDPDYVYALWCTPFTTTYPGALDMCERCEKTWYPQDVAEDSCGICAGYRCLCGHKWLCEWSLAMAKGELVFS